MTKHTPGPWKKPAHRLHAAAPETAAERDRLKESNAELLAALKRMIFDWDGEPEDITEAQDAIAKAEGKR